MMRVHYFLFLSISILDWYSVSPTASAWLQPKLPLSKSTPRSSSSSVSWRASTDASDDSSESNDSIGRRSFLDQSVAGLSSGLAFGGALAFAPTASVAATANPAPTTGDASSLLVSRERIATLLHVVPTFTLVDPKGVPYMVVGEDAKVTGYLFTEYGEAERILKLARSSADKAIREQRKKQQKNKNADANEDLNNPWKQARISTVPLDFAITLVTKSMSGASNNYFQVAPSVIDIDDALAVTNKTSLAEGKVPLFYYEDFTTNNESVSPLYFRKSELQAAFKKERPGEALPQLSVTELFSVLAELVTSEDAELKTLVFVPPKESAKKAVQCQSDVPFLLGQRNIVL